MAKYNYDPITKVALDTVERFGTDVYLVKDTSSLWEKKYDRELLQQYWENTATAAIVYIEPVGLGRNLGDGVLTQFKNDEIDGHLVKRTDMLLLATKLPEPELGDIIEIGSKKYKYMSHTDIAPNNVVILRKIQVRI